MNTKATPTLAAAAVQTSAHADQPQSVQVLVLPPVPGGGSWRPNAAGDGWVENLPADPVTDTLSTNPQPE